MNNHFIDQLIDVVGKKHVLHTPEDLAVYSYDGTFAEGSPEVVVLPANTEEVSQAVKLAAEARVPIVPRGMGSGMAAGSIPMVAGGMVVSLTRMNHVLEIDTENSTV
jgi:glycolate oxidase